MVAPESMNFDREISPATLRAEIDASDVKYKALLSGLDEEMRKYAGPGRGAMPDDWDPENHAFEWTVMFASQVASGDPTFRFGSKRQGKQSLKVEALEYGANRWARQTDLRGAISLYALDFAFRWCVAIVTPAKVKQATGDDPPYMPMHKRISPRYYRADAAAEEREHERWRAHLVIRPIGEIIAAAESGEEEGWNLEVLREIRTKGLSMSDRRAQVSANEWTGAEREDFAYWEIWCRDEKVKEENSADAGFNGAIYTLYDGEITEDWVREPRDFFGLRDGPYVVGGAHVVMDESQPLAPLVAHKAQAEYRNRIARAMIVGVEAYKRLVVTRSQKLKDAIEGGPNDHVFAIEDALNLSEALASIEVGGISQQLLVADERADETLQRVSGLADFLKGVASNITATEATQLGSAAASRIAHDVDKFEQFIIGIVKRFAFYAMADETVSIDLGEDSPVVSMEEDGSAFQVTQIDGGWDGEVLREFEALDIAIEPFSMSQSSQAQDMLKLQLVDQHVQLLVAAGPNAPFINWDKYAAIKEELTHVTGLRELANTEMMREYGAMMMQMQQAPPAATAQRQPQPRLGFDQSSKPAGGGGGGQGGFGRGQRQSPSQMAGGMGGGAQKPKTAKGAA